MSRLLCAETKSQVLPSLSTWQVGQWVAYQIQDRQGRDRLLEIALVGKKRIGETDYYWCEWQGQEDGTSVIVKQLLSPDDYRVDQVIIKRGEKQALQLPTGTTVTLKGGESFPDFFRQLRSREFTAGNVPITGVVRATLPRIGGLRLLASGLEGAQTKITGEPRSLKIPQLGGIKAK